VAVPRLSIVLPNYNYARYLDERIQSLLAQTWCDFELLILDDASQDNSREVIERYTHDPRVRAHYYAQNSGSAYPRWNDGAAMATGEYLLFAGADDSCHPTMVEKLLAKLEAHPSVGLAWCHSLVIDEAGQQIGSTAQWARAMDDQRWLVDYTDSGRNECQYLLVSNNAIPNASAVLMRRRLFVEAGGFDTSLHQAADYLMWVKLLLVSDVAYVAEPLNYWRWHKASPTYKNMNHIADAPDIEEIYRVLLYLARRLDVPAARYQEACEGWAGRWMNRVVETGWRIPLWRHRRIYRLAREFDPRVGRRLPRLLLTAYIKHWRKPDGTPIWLRAPALALTALRRRLHRLW
jgi:glycosyltransferase involved in cell wall biosynthesis